MSNRAEMRQFVSFAVLLVGAVLLAYGLFFHSAVISTAQDTKTATGQSEASLIREVAIGGLELDESGKVKKTYSGKAPKACPT